MEVIDFNIPKPNFHVKRINNNPIATHKMVENAGNVRATKEAIVSPVSR